MNYFELLKESLITQFFKPTYFGANPFFPIFYPCKMCETPSDNNRSMTEKRIPNKNC